MGEGSSARAARKNVTARSVTGGLNCTIALFAISYNAYDRSRCGIDIGGSKTQAVLLDEQGRIVADGSAEALARQVAGAVEALRGLNLYKPPGVAETIDWAQALAALGRTELDESIVEATLGAVLKYREDQDRTRQHGIADLVKQAFERGFQST